MEVTRQEILEATEYLNSLDIIQKGQTNMDLTPATNGGGSENLTDLKTELVGLIKKARDVQAKIDSMEKEKPEEIEKAVTPEEPKEIKKAEGTEEEPEEKSEETPEEEPKGKPNLDKEEIIKSIKSEILGDFNDQLSAKDEVITLLKSQLEDITGRVKEVENSPIRKSFTNSAPMNYKDRFEKAQGEGKTVVSKDLQKSQVSNHIYNLFVEATDEVEKGFLGNAITQFESSGFLDTSIQKKISDKYNVEII